MAAVGAGWAAGAARWGPASAISAARRSPSAPSATFCPLLPAGPAMVGAVKGRQFTSWAAKCWTAACTGRMADDVQSRSATSSEAKPGHSLACC